MIHIAKMVYPDYDIYKSIGYPNGHPIPGHDAAYRIVADMVRHGYYVDFVELLIKIDTHGYMGHSYSFRGLDDVISDVKQSGYGFDEVTGLFFEDQSQQITRNWGRLLEGDERQMAVMRLDIAGYSILVKENPKQLINKAYDDLRNIVTTAVVSRLGRLWIWEGDGALGVFMLDNYSSMAIFSAMEILNEMFLYNRTDNPLKSAIKLRLSVHSGDFIYSDNNSECLKADIVRVADILESKAAVPNSLVISESLAKSQDQSLLDLFSSTKIISNSATKYRIYQVCQKNE